MIQAQLLQVAVSVGLSVSMIFGSLKVLWIIRGETLPDGVREYVVTSAIVLIAISIATLGYILSILWGIDLI